MEILHTTDLSCEGNGCYIYKSVSLVKAFGMYTVLTAVKCVGHYNTKDFYIQSEVDCDYDQAVWRYQIAGGKIK